jgi:hypothetical protein
MINLVNILGGMNYEKIKQYYDTGLWNEFRLYNIVGKPTGITIEEYELITGKQYISHL